MRERILEMLGLDIMSRLLIIDADGLWQRYDCDDALTQAGFRVEHFSEAAALLQYCEACVPPRSDERKFALVIDSPDISLPPDICQKFACVSLSYGLLFPTLDAPTLRALPGADLNALASAQRNFVLPDMYPAQTRNFCLHTCFTGKYGSAYGAELMEHAAESAGQARSHRDWEDVAICYGRAAMIAHGGAPVTGFSEMRQEIEDSFARWLREKYSTLPNVADSRRPVLLSRVPDFIRRAATKPALIVMDGMAFENFFLIADSLAAAGMSFELRASFSFFPTVTAVARQAIFSGLLPPEHPKPFSLENEERQWRAYWREQGLRDADVDFRKGIPAELPPRKRVLGIIVSIIDELMHSELQGLTGLQQGLRTWLEGGQLLGFIQSLLAQGYAVFMTSDHGNTAARGEGRFRRPGVLAEPASRRAVLYKEPFDARELANFTVARYDGTCLPEGYTAYLSGTDRCFGERGKEYIAHGGATLEESVVPFARIYDHHG